MTDNDRGQDKPLFTPGPLTTSMSVKRAMLHDVGSRDDQFIGVIDRIRHQLLELAGVSQEGGYETVLMQGSGTFAIESVISTVVDPQGKLLVLVNGAYGRRIAQMAEVHRIPLRVLEYAEDEQPRPEELREALDQDPQISDVAVVHCETTSGVMNPVMELGAIIHQHGKRFLLDSMSAFGGVPFDMLAAHVDYLISSANKCIEGVPGFGFVICRREALREAKGRARTVSLDLLAQWQGLESNGQFRFTPPTHTLLAFQQALAELQDEGGIEARAARYRTNYECLVNGMQRLGFQEYLPRGLQGHIITSFCYPPHPRFTFAEFYGRLNAKGFVIYPGKVSNADCFRIGHIGRLFEADMQALLAAIAATLEEMGVVLEAARK